jgi:hypothetical protein
LVGDFQLNNTIPAVGDVGEDRMLYPRPQKSLDVRLLELRGYLDEMGYPAAQECVGRIMAAVTYPRRGGRIKTNSLVRSDWENTWRHEKYIVTAWFGDVGHNAAARCLCDLFTALARFLQDSPTPRLLAQHADGLSERLQDYLDTRGHPASPYLRLGKDRCTVTLYRGGAVETHKVSDPDAFAALEVLWENRGIWVTRPTIGAKLGSEDIRVDRLFNKLPRAVRDLFTSKRGMGYYMARSG